MNIAHIKYEAVINNKSNRSSIGLDEKCTGSVLDSEVLISLALCSNVINVTVKNNDSKPVVLNSLSFELLSSGNYKEDYCIINPKKSNEKITYISMNKVNSDTKIESHLFEIFIDDEDCNNKIFGFLGCKYSRNLIENIVKENELKIFAVYSFINQVIFPGEECRLDPIYIKEGRNIFSLFNSFVDRRLADLGEGYNKKLMVERSDIYSILFTYRVNSNTLKVEDKPVFIKVNGKKLYAVDISRPEGKKQVFVNANAVLSRASALDLSAVGEYINVAHDNKLFNVNHELTKLLASLKTEFQEVQFYSDDCPLGLADEYIILKNSRLVFEDKRNILDYIGKRKISHHINYDFFIKLLMQRLVRASTKSFSVNSPKVEELMSVILGSADIDAIKNKELLDMARDIDKHCAVIPLMDRKKAFSLLITGRKYIYVAVFNMEKETIRFYCDLIANSGYKDLDGVVEEVYSNTSYLISDGKLYIKNLPPMDCCLFKKPIKDCVIENAAV
jgi:hypothetical protein